MNRFVMLVFIAALSLLASDVSAETVRTVIPRSTVNYLSVPVAQAKGFFAVRAWKTRPLSFPEARPLPPWSAAMWSIAAQVGRGMRAAVRGAPIKAVMFQTEKVTWYLISAPDIQKISDLKGKPIAVGTVGDTQDALITMLLEREGVSGRDISRVAMPSRSTVSTILSLKTGAISAAVVNADESLLSEREGLRTLTFIGDLFHYPFQGFMATDKMIAERPNDIKRWLRAMSKALMFIREQPEEAADIAMKKIPMGNVSRPLVIEAFRRFAKAFAGGCSRLSLPARHQKLDGI